MKKNSEKIITAQTMANDLVAEVSAMINQDIINKENVQKLKKRLEELAEEINSIKTKEVDF